LIAVVSRSLLNDFVLFAFMIFPFNCYRNDIIKLSRVKSFISGSAGLKVLASMDFFNVEVWTLKGSVRYEALLASRRETESCALRV